MLAVQASILGPALDLDSAGTGQVHSVFERAVNIAMGDDLWTLVASGQADLAFGIRTVLNDCAALGASRGEPVAVRAGFIGIGTGAPRVVVDCRSAARWQPAPPHSPAPGLEGRLAELAAATAGRCWHGAAAIARRVTAALLDEPLSLPGVLAQVVGRGPGLTPAGDDVLVGILAALRLAPSTLAATHAAVLARSVEPRLGSTTDLSAHLLRQAARGLFSRSLHELVSALADDTAPGPLHERIDRALAIGATSGADACTGVLAVAPHFHCHPGERAAAWVCVRATTPASTRTRSR
ncbi:MAG: DUF2877 domain-containing protein [Caldimonas sp.]